MATQRQSMKGFQKLYQLTGCREEWSILTLINRAMLFHSQPYKQRGGK